MDHLPLQVALVDHIEVHDSDRADTGGSEILQHGRPESASADDQHSGGSESSLAVETELGQRDVARETLKAFARQSNRLDKGRQRHGY